MIGNGCRIFGCIIWSFGKLTRAEITRYSNCHQHLLYQTCRMASGLRGRKRIAAAESLSDRIDESDVKPPRKSRKAPRSKSTDLDVAQASNGGAENLKPQSTVSASGQRGGDKASAAEDFDSLQSAKPSIGTLKENKASARKKARKAVKSESLVEDKTEIMQQVQIKQEPIWDETKGLEKLSHSHESVMPESRLESKKGGRKKNAQTGKNLSIKQERAEIKQEPTSFETMTTADTRPASQVKSNEQLKKTEGSSTRSRSLKIPDSGTPGSKFVGAHTSIAGGLYKAVEMATSIGAKAFGLFLKSQRQWAAKPLTDEDAEKFKDALEKAGYHPNSVLPHGCYLLNCGSPNAETLSKSRACLVDELQRCEKLGLTLYNFHPGSTCGEIEVDECLDRIAESINMAHAKTQYVVTVIENMCGQGNTVGGRFEELRGIIDRVKDKGRVGVCLDTCHAFAAGFDLASDEGFQAFVKSFDQIVGLEYLRGLHLNDSKGKLGCHLDRHENIGRGHLGLDTFRRVMNEPSFCHIPMIIETPMGLSDEEEICLLYSLCKAKEEA